MTDIGHVRNLQDREEVLWDAVGSNEFVEAQARPETFAENSVVTLAAAFLGVDI